MQDFTVAPLLKMRVKVQSIIVHNRSVATSILGLDMHRMLGTIQYMAPLVPRGRLRFRPIQWWASEVWDQTTGNWDQRIQVPSWIIHQLAWWASPAVMQGLSLEFRETELTLFTGASTRGWGAQLQDHSISGLWLWTEAQRQNHINILEMEACRQKFLQPLTRLCGPFDVRQRHGGVVHQTGWRDQVVQTNPIDHQTIEVLRSQADCVNTSPSARSEQHSGQQAVTTGTDASSRMGNSSGPVATCVQPLGTSVDRFVCYICQQEVSQVRVPIPGSTGCLHRHPVDTMEPYGNGVSLSAVQDHSISVGQDLSVSVTQGHSYSAIQNGRLLDAGASTALPGKNNSRSRRSETSNSSRSSNRRSRREPDLPVLKPTRLETLKVLFKKLGYDDRASQIMTSTLRHSSINLYESHWQRFVDFCRRKKTHVFQVQSQLFCRYLVELFDDVITPSTVISHRTSVAWVLRH